MKHRLKDLPLANTIDFDAFPRPRRPKIVSFIGWICAGVGYLGFVMKGSQLPSLFFPEWVKRNINPNWEPVHYSREQFTVIVLFLLTEMLVGLIAIAGGLGLLRMREWGRKTALLYAVSTFIVTLAKAAWQVYIFDAMLDMQIATTTQPVNREQAGNRQFFALVTMSIFQLLWPVIIATILTRRYVKDAFDAVRLGDGASDGWKSNSPS